MSRLLAPAVAADVSGAHSPAPEWLNGGRIPSLDGLRAVAILAVIYSHVMFTDGFPSFARLPGSVSRHLGAFGVQVFFVISGFLITTLIVREIKRTGRLDLKQFYIARSLKIFPPFLAVLAALAIMAICGLVELKGLDWLTACSFTTNFVRRPNMAVEHFWSLSIEEHFYLVWPLVLASCSVLRSWRIALGCVTFCLAYRCLLANAFPEYHFMAMRWTFGRVDGIVFGCLAALAAWDPIWRQRMDRVAYRRPLFALVVVALVTSFAISVLSWRCNVAISFTAESICVALILWTVVRRPETLLGLLLNQSWLQAIGLASYSLYLWQQFFVVHGETGIWRTFPLNLALAFGAGFLSYLLIERPIVNLKKRARAARKTVRLSAGQGEGLEVASRSRGLQSQYAPAAQTC
jgi:peptidoglycan/LPS O-acetylase OafA/YrhL